MPVLVSVMDTIPIGVELVVGAIVLLITFSFVVRVGVRLSRSRCPHCGNYRAAREVSAEKQVTAHSHREEYDHQLGHTREIHETEVTTWFFSIQGFWPYWLRRTSPRMTSNDSRNLSFISRCHWNVRFAGATMSVR